MRASSDGSEVGSVNPGPVFGPRHIFGVFNFSLNKAVEARHVLFQQHSAFGGIRQPPEAGRRDIPQLLRAARILVVLWSR